MVKTMSSKHFTFVALAAATLAASCTSDDIAEHNQDPTPGETKTVELTANLNDGKSSAKRVGIANGSDGYASFYWQNGDGILVQTKGSDGKYTGTEFTTSAETGSTSATFKGTLDSGSELGTYAVYPSRIKPDEPDCYSYTHEFSDKTLTFTLPGEYKYSVVESNIFPTTTDGITAYPANTTRIPMVGKIENGKIAFKHIAGLVVIRIDEMPAEKGYLSFLTNNQVYGNFTCDLSADEPKITTVANASDYYNVKLYFSNATKGKVGVFYLPLPTGSYSGVMIQINYGNGNDTYQRVNYGNLYVPRASVTAIPLYTINGKLEKFSSISGNEYTFNGQKFVDLGYSSGGLLWAEKNVGADSETGYGNYYAWGEIASKSNYSWDNYKYGTSESNITKYNNTDSKTILEAEDDAATRNWGNGCRMPTYADFSYLNINCSPSAGTKNGIKGYTFTYNGSSIFLPAAGDSRSQTHNIAKYWSSTASNKFADSAFFNFLTTDAIEVGNYYERRFGCPVRAVTER